MKTKTLFDHIKQVTNVQNQLYWDELSESDKKTWSNYMVHRFLSMKADWIEVVNEIQQYWELKPKDGLSILYKSTSERKYILTIH